MNNVLLPVFYLSPVQWFAEFLDENNNVVFEEWENFLNKPTGTVQKFMVPMVSLR